MSFKQDMLQWDGRPVNFFEILLGKRIVLQANKRINQEVS